MGGEGIAWRVNRELASGHNGIPPKLSGYRRFGSIPTVAAAAIDPAATTACLRFGRRQLGRCVAVHLQHANV
jgi:hypothetical protein